MRNFRMYGSGSDRRIYRGSALFQFLRPGREIPFHRFDEESPETYTVTLGDSATLVSQFTANAGQIRNLILAVDGHVASHTCRSGGCLRVAHSVAVRGAKFGLRPRAAGCGNRVGPPQTWSCGRVIDVAHIADLLAFGETAAGTESAGSDHVM